MMGISGVSIQFLCGAAPRYPCSGLFASTSTLADQFKDHVKSKKKRCYFYLKEQTFSRLSVNCLRADRFHVDSSYYGAKLSSRALHGRCCQCADGGSRITSEDNGNGAWLKEVTDSANGQVPGGVNAQKTINHEELHSLRNDHGGIVSNDDKSVPSGSAKKTVQKKKGSSVEDEAWRLLQESMVYYCGSPVGTIAAKDPSDGNVLNYDHVFIRDFIPSGIAFLLKGEFEPMGPPPPKTDNLMGPPPPKNPNTEPESEPEPEPEHVHVTAAQTLEEDAQIGDQAASETLEEDAQISDNVAAHSEETTHNPNRSTVLKPSSTASGSKQTGVNVPYTIPPWSQPPGHPFSLEVLKDGAILEQLDVSEKGAYMFGRIDLCDFVLEHPTISRFHAVLQFKQDEEAFIYDLGSTHGTFVNKSEVKKKEYTNVHVGDVIRFGQSSRLYILQGPSELMPPEGDLEKIRTSKALREEMLDREASLARARVEASYADGASWGFAEDAVEESTEDVADEVTWQTYTGQLTERQEKTRGKILKRMEKVANMKKEIDAIRAKDIAQGGLTQGQQTQIARNEQRMAQIMEELESLEETLNESIQESLGARTGKVSLNRKPGNLEDEVDTFSDDDDFYDRTKKNPSTKKSGGQQSVETADTLLDKKEGIAREMEEKKSLLLKEREKLVSVGSKSEGGDDLDAYMSGLSSQLVVDKTVKIQKELSDLQSELDRTMYLLKIADPLGDAARKREVKAKVVPKPNQPVLDLRKQPQPKQKKPIRDEMPISSSTIQETSSSAQDEKPASPGQVKDACENKEKKPTVYTATKPQWLGDAKGMKLEDDHVREAVEEVAESDSFVDYKDRKKVLVSANNAAELENAAPGLIIRKRKPTEEPDLSVDKVPRVSAPSSSEAENTAADAVALLLKHKRGYIALDEDIANESHQCRVAAPGKATSQPKRVLGPSKPEFLDKGPDYEAWVPPEGQTGDGRTSLNDRLGY